MTDPYDPLPGLLLSRGGLARSAERRADPRLLERLLADPATQVVAIRGDRMAVADGAEGAVALVTRPPAPGDGSRLAVFLGEDRSGGGDGGGGGEAAYRAVVGVLETEPADEGWRTLRAVGALLADRDAGIFATLLALAHWHRTHPYCPRCGGPTEPVSAGWTRRCPADDSEHFPRTDPAVIVSVVDDAGRLLLGRGLHWPEDQWSVLAGFLEPGESIEAAVVREVAEESGVQVTDVRYLGDQPWPFPTSLMIGLTARAVTTDARPDPSELAEVRWVTRGEYAALLRSGGIRVPGGISIARRLIERWLGEPVEQAAGGAVVEGWRPTR